MDSRKHGLIHVFLNLFLTLFIAGYIMDIVERIIHGVVCADYKAMPDTGGKEKMRHVGGSCGNKKGRRKRI